MLAVWTSQFVLLTQSVAQGGRSFPLLEIAVALGTWRPEFMYLFPHWEFRLPSLSASSCLVLIWISLFSFSLNFRETERRKIFHVLIHSLDAHNRQSWDRSKLETQNSMLSVPCGCLGPKDCLPGCVLPGGWIKKEATGTQPIHCNTASLHPATLNIHPLLLF